jgi:hypothetical protein
LLRHLPESFQDRLRGLKTKLRNGLKFHEFDAVWERIVEIRPDQELTTFPGAFVDWDNTPRYKGRATIFRGSTPELFGYWLNNLIKTMPKRNLPDNFIFLNAWNEWSEGAYLEPDEKNGYKYLQAMNDELTKK